MNNILRRKSIRKFNDQDIEMDKVLKMVEAGMAAPCSKNKRPWQFVIIKDKSIMKKFALGHKNWKLMGMANKAILVCGDFSLEEREVHNILTTSAAAENILLEAVEQEVGAVWLGLYPDQTRIELSREFLELPEHVLPVALIALGYSDDDYNRERKIDENKIHIDKWKGTL
jgi:nitroreductase